MERPPPVSRCLGKASLGPPAAPPSSHPAETVELASGRQVLRRGDEGLVGASDPRGGGAPGQD